MANSPVLSSNSDWFYQSVKAIKCKICELLCPMAFFIDMRFMFINMLIFQNIQKKLLHAKKISLLFWQKSDGNFICCGRKNFISFSMKENRMIFLRTEWKFFLVMKESSCHVFFCRNRWNIFEHVRLINIKW